jgi:hypothetical protein
MDLKAGSNADRVLRVVVLGILTAPGVVVERSDFDRALGEGSLAMARGARGTEAAAALDCREIEEDAGGRVLEKVTRGSLRLPAVELSESAS